MTERDIVRALAHQADPDTAWVADEGIRYIPVKTKGEVVGLVAAEDILDLLAAKLYSTRAPEL